MALPHLSMRCGEDKAGVSRESLPANTSSNPGRLAASCWWVSGDTPLSLIPPSHCSFLQCVSVAYNHGPPNTVTVTWTEEAASGQSLVQCLAPSAGSGSWVLRLASLQGLPFPSLGLGCFRLSLPKSRSTSQLEPFLWGDLGLAPLRLLVSS